MASGTESTATETALLATTEGAAGSGTAVLAAGEAGDDSLAPHAALEALRREAPPAHMLLANLMDEAMEAMLRKHAPGLPSRQSAGLAASAAAGSVAGEVEDFGAVLTPAEAAALAEEIRSERPTGFPERPEFGGHVITAMPTDEELAALFAGSQTEQGGSAAPASLPGRGGAADISEAALALEKELARDESPEAEEPDADEILADVALEARGAVNLFEPPAREVEPPSVGSGLGMARPLEPEGARTQVPWWLRPLVWLNAPLATPRARDGAGKLALLILLNATAVLVYVYVLRR